MNSELAGELGEVHVSCEVKSEAEEMDSTGRTSNNSSYITHRRPHFLRDAHDNTSSELLIVFLIVVALAALPTLLLAVLNGRTGANRKVTQLRGLFARCSVGGVWRGLCDGLHIELERLPSVKELIAEAEADPEAGTRRSLLRLSPLIAQAYHAWRFIPLFALGCREAMMLTPIGPNSIVNERAIRARYVLRSGEPDDELGDKVWRPLHSDAV